MLGLLRMMMVCVRPHAVYVWSPKLVAILVSEHHLQIITSMTPAISLGGTNPIVTLFLCLSIAESPLLILSGISAQEVGLRSGTVPEVSQI